MQPTQAASSVSDCLEELERIMRAGALEAGSRGYALLIYLIDHYQKVGPDVPVKAYSIAIDVLNRPTSFDPSGDSIVRVEVGRLRKLLEMYNLGPGAADPIQFSIPRGQSHLKVTRRNARSVVRADTRRVFPLLVTASRRKVAVCIIISVLLALGFGLTYGIARKEGGAAEVEAALAEEFPRLFVQSFQKSGMVAEAFPRNALSSFLAAQLSEFKTFRVIDPSFPSTLPVRAHDFILEGKTFRKSSSNEKLVDLRLTLKDGFGTVLWTDTIEFDINDWGRPDPVLQAVSSIASTLGGAMGVIDSVGRSRLEAEMVEWSTGTRAEFHCILIWQSFDLTKGVGDRSAARRCLSDLAGRQSRVSQIWAAFGFSLLLDWVETGADPNGPQIQRALEAANRAILLDPEGPDGHESLGSILTALKRFPEARETLERAKRINPSNLETILKLGWLDCLEGDWETGRARIESVIARYSAVPGWYRLPLALSAFRDGNPTEMLRQAKAITASGDQRGVALVAIAAHLLGDRREVAMQLAALSTNGKTMNQSLGELQAVFPDSELFSRISELSVVE